MERHDIAGDVSAQTRPPGCHRLIAGCTILIVLVSTVWRYYQADFRSEIEWDELITLDNYTWAGVNADGTRRSIDRVSDLEDLGQVSLRRMFIGTYCSLGRWTEPNNHVHNSMLTNVSIATARPTISAMRLPALAAAAGFSLASAYLCCRSGLPLAAPLVAVICMWHPYVVVYSQRCRGYTLVLFLSVLFIIMLQKVYEKPNGYIRSIAMASIAIAMFQTLVNLIVDWVVPVYLFCLLFPSFCDASSDDKTRIGNPRNSLFLQFVGIVAVAGVFFIDRLPYLYSSAMQYGETVSGFRDGVHQGMEFLGSLFPGTSWKIVGLIGSCGIVVALTSRQWRILAYPYLAAFVVSFVHYFANMRFPYNRNAGIFLPLFIFGFGCVVQRTAATLPLRYQRLMVLALFWCGTLWAIYDTSPSAADSTYRELIEVVRSYESESAPALLLTGKSVPLPITLYRPESWELSEYKTEEPASYRMIAVENNAFVFPSSGSNPTRNRSSFFEGWAGAKSTKTRKFNVWDITAERAGALDDGTTFDPRIVLWYPPFETVSVTPQQIIDRVEASGLGYHEIHVRYQAKMEVFDQLKCVAFFVDAPVDGGSSPRQKYRDDLAKCEKIIHSFGGRWLALRPEKAKDGN